MMRDSQGNIIERDERGIWLRDPYTGKRCPYVAGGSGDVEDDDTDDDADDDDDEDDTDEDKPAARKHTDDDLQRVAARERKQGRRAGRRELQSEIAKKLGMTVEEAAAKLAKGKPDATDDDASGSDSAKDHELEQREMRAVVKENTADVVAELVVQGLDRTLAKQLAKSVSLDLSDPELDEDDIADAVESFKKLTPQLFGSDDAGAADEDEDEGRKPKDSTSRGNRKKSSKPTSAADRARERFLERHPDRKSA